MNTSSIGKHMRLRSTAYHEAGHAVAAIFNGVRFRYVSVVPDEAGNLGHVLFYRMSKGPKAMHARGIVSVAGEVAQRRFSPSSVRRYHGSCDRINTVTFANECAGSAKQAELLVKLWTVQAQELIEHRWPCVVSLAEALLTQKVIAQADAARIVMDVQNRPALKSAEKERPL